MLLVIFELVICLDFLLSKKSATIIPMIKLVLNEDIINPTLISFGVKTAEMIHKLVNTMDVFIQIFLR